jgi:hypothetical protein
MTEAMDKKSHRMRAAVAVTVAVTLVALFTGAEVSDRAAIGDTRVKCVSWKAEARFVGFAYDHLVHLDNRCPHPASCTVKTDINPDPVTVSLSTGEKKTVLTFRGSPARRFKATVMCEKK